MRKTNLFILLLFVLRATAQSTPPEKQPNIVYILTDDLGYNDLGCYGQDIIETPNIDALAKGGKLFTQHYTAAPVCAPSRCMLLTGQQRQCLRSGKR
jgi:arylsulfatase